jgi:hypothetical protein
MGVGCCWDWEAADWTEEDSVRVAGYLGKVVLSALMVKVCWECMMGAPAFHLLDPLAEQDWSASGLLASLPGQ